MSFSRNMKLRKLKIFICVVGGHLDRLIWGRTTHVCFKVRNLYWVVEKACLLNCKGSLGSIYSKIEVSRW